MIEELTTGSATCEAPECDRALPEEPAIVFETAAGRQSAYECACGAVTITVSRPESTR
ncbi:MULTISPECIES: hypothetical protein [Halomicrobium]|uniref:hypothetical protein n=1 Tax=Halomicrobium TaxID=203135 RepID=UPI0012A8AED8|nr:MULTISPECIES: hypothetical protein [Halomicrobium]MBO4246872.1 hypothetical protein [Halomicrobium sp. IBSBa]QGA83370.1 Uncharacterized protein LC1Hm_2336 [Halomicrobium sp. LC1Hm]